MRIPGSFKAAQRAAMQDKVIAHHPAAPSTGALGGAYTTPAPLPTGEYWVNAQIISDAMTAQEYGLHPGRDIRVTSSDPLPIPVGDFVLWEGRYYRVVGAYAHDSHTALLGEAVE